MANSTQARIMYHTGFYGKGFTDDNFLGQALLTKNDTISPVITHLMGKDSDKFPLTFLTEGQAGGIRPIELNSIEYDWPIIGRMKNGDVLVASQYGAGDKPGLNNQPFYLTFATNWLKNQHTLRSPNGIQARVMAEPTPIGALNYRYRLQLINPDVTAFVPASELVLGSKWTMTGGASVSTSRSRGNSSNVMTPGKMKNQISILRKSYNIAGNITNKYVEFQFDIPGKGKTNYWIDFETFQHMQNWKQSNEEHFWFSQYNRNAAGYIPLRDPDTNLPIPIGAGVEDQIPNQDTYGFLTTKKLKDTVGDVMYGATDTKAMSVTLYTGIGGAEEFDNAMKNDLKTWSIVPIDKFVKGSNEGGDRQMMYGGFFTAYEHVDGHTIVLKRLSLLDYGSIAENSPLHPVTGKPMSSYNMYFIDQSDYDGQRNVVMACEKGRSMVTGVLRGMADTPYDFKGNMEKNISTDADESSIHFLCSKGICIRRNTHCFKLTCDLT